MAIQRKSIPEFIQWDQQSILAAIAKIASELSTLTNLTGNPASDTRGAVTRNVRDYEIIAAIERNSEVLDRIHLQLSFITDVNLNEGDHS